MGAPKWLFRSAIFLKVLDVVTTYYLVYHYGARVESNPFVYDMMWAYGHMVGLTINAGIYSLLMYLLYAYKRHKLLMIAVGFMTLVVCTNILNILSY